MNEPAVVCRGLVKRFKDVTAVAGVDFEVRRGECFGLLGPNGAGKTTTVEVLEGLLPADGGVVRVLGQTWNGGDERSLRERLGIQLQETEFPERLTVRENIRLFRSFYRRGRTEEDVLAKLGLNAKADSWFTKLSGGQKQRLALACAFVCDPEILFLDEPTTGLDPRARTGLWDVIEEFRAASGTIVMTTHYMEEAARLCDRLAIMDHGRIIAIGTPAELIRSLGADQIIEFETRSEPDVARLAQLPGVNGITRRIDRFVLRVSELRIALPAVIQELDRQRVELQTVATHQATLDDVFLHLTGRGLLDD